MNKIKNLFISLLSFALGIYLLSIAKLIIQHAEIPELIFGTNDTLFSGHYIDENWRALMCSLGAGLSAICNGFLYLRHAFWQKKDG